MDAPRFRIQIGARGQKTSGPFEYMKIMENRYSKYNGGERRDENRRLQY